MKIITAGFGATDIDALACSVAYQELLTLQKVNSGIYINQDYTISVPEMVKDWGLPLNVSEEELLKQENEFVLVDFSDPHKLMINVDKDKIVEVYDHHFFGFENYWPKLIEEKAVIEAVGSCASLIWRAFKNKGLLAKMSLRSARFIYAAIISNTLNIQAGVTTDLDKEAVSDVVERCSLDEAWIGEYYRQIEKELLKDPINTIDNDTRLYEISNKTWVIGQLELWDAKDFVENNTALLEEFIASKEKNSADLGFLTIVSIKEGKNYIIPRDDESATILNSKLELLEQEGILLTKKLLLRKEIYKLLEL